MDTAGREIADRIGRLTRELERRDLDAILLDDGEALSYFADFDISLTLYRACVIKRDGSAFFVLRALDVAPLAEKSWIKDVVGYPDWVDPASAVAQAIRERGLDAANIGIDFGSHALTVQIFADLKRELPKVCFEDAEHLPWTMRQRKSRQEIDYLRKASQIADLTMGAILATAKPGITERQAAGIAVESFVRHGGDPGMLGVITKGDEWGYLHGHLHDVPLGEGDVLHIELCPRYCGYSARIMRCIVMGPLSEELTRVARTLIELQDRQIEALVPGASAKDVDAVLREPMLASGLRQDYPNISGYTLGYYADQAPRASDFTWTFHPQAQWTLETGMVFHMYTSARGIAISETVLVNPDGPERLTTFERKLFQVP